MLNPGDIIAQKYQVVRLIGQGGMSNIYLVRRVGADPSEGNWVIKEMTVSYRDPDDQKRAVDQFLREASLLQRLKHKNLPKVIDQFVLGNRYYFVMEFVEGEDLGKILTRNPQGMTENLVVGWAVECATVLYYLHSQKPPIIFRDVKPSNIMIAKGSVKIIDFGIARHFDPFKKKDTMRIGSPGYAPPEQYSGQTDARSDIFSLGVTLHQCLTGRDPSETQTPFKLPPVRSLKPSVSPGMEAIITKATEMDPTRRYKTALEMKRALQELSGVHTGALPAPTGSATGAPLVHPVGSQTIPPPQPVGAATSTPPPPALRGSTIPYISPPPTPTTPPPPPAPPPTPPPAGTPVGKTLLPPPVGKSILPPSALNPPPRRRWAGFLMILFMLSMLGTAGYIYLADIRTALLRIPGVQTLWQRLGGVPTPTPSPSPTLPTEPVHRALALLEMGQTDDAMTLLEEQMRRGTTDPLAQLAYNNGLVLGMKGEKAVLAVAFPTNGFGLEWLRGVALAQRDINKQGGVGGHRLLLLPQEYAWPADKTPLLPAPLEERRLLTVLGLLPPSKTDVKPSAPLLADPHTASAKETTAAATLTAAVHASRIAIVALPPAGKELRAAFEEQKQNVVGVFQDGPNVLSQLHEAHPDLTIVVGDGVSAAKWVADALPKMTGQFLTLSVVPDVKGKDANRVWAVTTYPPDSQEIAHLEFSFTYLRAFDSRPGYWAARGYDTVMAWAGATDGLSNWTSGGVQKALESAYTRHLSGITGPLLKAADLKEQTEETWYLVHYQNGALVTVKAANF